MLQKLIEFANSWQSETAIIFGMVFQFFLSPVKNMKIAVTIIMASFFIALYVVAPFLDVLDIGKGTNIEKSAYAISALLSMEILSLIINIVPKGIAYWIRTKLGIEDDK